MLDIGKIRKSSQLKGAIGKSLRHIISMGADAFGDSPEEQKHEAVRLTVLALIKTILENNGVLDAADVNLVRELLAEQYSPGMVEDLVKKMYTLPHITADEAALIIRDLPQTDRERLIKSLLVLASNCNYCCNRNTLISDLAQKIGVSESFFQDTKKEVEADKLRRQQMFRSGAGILAALIVIAVFILTATLLKSVIFGLIAAYILLPIEKYFERKLRSQKGVIYLICHSIDNLLKPLKTLSEKITRKDNSQEDAEKIIQLKQNRKIIGQAVTLTCIFVAFFAFCFVAVLTTVANNYVHHLTESVKQMSAVAHTEGGVKGANNAVLQQGTDQIIERSRVYLENLRLKFESIPMVRFVIDQVSLSLNDDATRREIMGMLLKRTGGLFSFTASILGMIGAILVDLLLSIFFFLLFLTKIAEFSSPSGSGNKQSEYLVRTVFNGNWLPGATEETINGARKIIGEVINKLRIWVKGYITLMMLDMTVYTTMFYLLNVPYFYILGPIAGCGILLPYIGPIISALLTLTVTLACGTAEISVFKLLGIGLTYLIYNGIIEQFILYPSVIGESLGLTTLETIIVVLLGAIFAGVAGMIFAIPTASVIKYLVPQIYKSFEKDGKHET